MNREQAATLISESFTSRFNRERFGELAVNLLNSLDTTKTFSRQRELRELGSRLAIRQLA